MQLVSKKELPRIKHRTATLVYFFMSGFGYSTWASRIPAIQQQLHINEAQLGTALLAAPIGVLVTVPFTSNLLNKYSSKSIMIFGAAFYNIMLALLAFTKQPWQLWVILFGFGSSRNLLNLSMNAQGVEVQRLYENSIITSFHAVWSMAGFAGAAVGYLFVVSGLPLAAHLVSVSIVMLVLSAAFYPNTYYTLNHMPPQKKFFVFPNKYLLVFAMIAFASMACENVMYDWSALFFQKAVVTTKETATAAFVLYMVCMTTGRFFGDKIVPKFGIVTILRYSGIFIFSGLLIASLFPYVIPAAIGFVLTGFGVSCIIPLVFSLAGKSTTMSSGTAIASVSTISYFGFLAIPPSVGYIAQVIGLRWSFCIMALFGAAIIFLVTRIRETK
ncbi:MAG: MFS transporter [Parafilimonas sp.]|nr:MFS transporter [Parafilimonas sp.]